jgi:aminoglycoside 6'-N-acetyltransferase I
MEEARISMVSKVPPMEIRPPKREEARAWAALRLRLWPDAEAGELAAETQAFLEGRRVATIDAAFLAVDGSTVAGFIEIALRPFSDGCRSQPVPHVEGWYLEPFARRSGIARALLAAAESWSSERGFVEMASDSEVDNEESIAAHGACGFAESERLVKFRKDL